MRLLFFLSFLCLPMMSALLHGQGTFGQFEKLVPEDRGEDHGFGVDVALDGDWAIVATARGGDPENAPVANSASAYLYARGAQGHWIEKQRFVFPNPTTATNFSTAVAIAEGIAIVGVTYEDTDAGGDNQLEDAGAVFVLTRNGDDVWEMTDKLVAADRQENDIFGLYLDTDGSSIIVGAVGQEFDAEGQNEVSFAGAAYLFTRDTTGRWRQEQKLVPSSRNPFDGFGGGVSIDGTTAVVGSGGFDITAPDGENLFQAGAAFVFERQEAGLWAETDVLVAGDPELRAQFGDAVAQGKDTIFVAAPRADTDSLNVNPVEDAGAVYVFVRDEVGVWYQSQKLTAPVRREDDLYGAALAHHGDRLLIGSLFNDLNAEETSPLDGAGAAYVYARSPLGRFDLERKIVAEDRSARDKFGASVAVSNDYIMVGANEEDRNATGSDFLLDAGATYVFFYPPPGNVCQTAIDVDDLLGSEAGETTMSSVYSNNGYTAARDETTTGTDCFTDSAEDPWQNSVWFTFTGDGNRFAFLIDGCNPMTEEALPKPQIAAYAGECGIVTPIACAEATSAAHAMVEIPTEPGVVYYLVIDGTMAEDTTTTGSFCITTTNLRPSSTRSPDPVAITAYPNPTEDVVNFGDTDYDVITVVSPVGRVTGRYFGVRAFNAAGYPPGVYSVRLQRGGYWFSARFVKK